MNHIRYEKNSCFLSRSLVCYVVVVVDVVVVVVVVVVVAVVENYPASFPSCSRRFRAHARRT